jgi:NADH-quinone oxidoreductase subunit C
MTTAISGLSVADRLNAALPGVVIDSEEGSVTVPAERVLEAALFLRDDTELDCKYLNSLTAVDWVDHFEVVYHLSSLAKNHLLVLKARAGHENPVVPSVSSIWLGANLQEREAFDLMGIVFSGHPSMKRIFLWEGFPGHPLRKDFLALPGGFKPGLQRFPYEFPEGQRSYPSVVNTTEPSAPAVPRLDQPPAHPFPIVEPPPEARPDQPSISDEQVQGAGSDPSRAGGTAEPSEERGGAS